MGRVQGKVAFITGAARGQGRSHAVCLAKEGADIIAVDLCAQIETVPYPMSTLDDLAETARLVEELDRRVMTAEVDVRDLAQTRSAVESALSEFGHIDIVIANSGIFSIAPSWELTEQQWDDMVDVNLTGVWKSVQPAIPSMIERRQGVIVLTSSVAGLTGVPNACHYVAAKHGVTGLMRTLAAELAPYNIRVNSVHPTTVNTEMIQNQGMYDLMVGDRNASREDAANAMKGLNALPISWVEPIDVSNAVLYLASDAGRFVTGVALPIDAGGVAPFKVPHEQAPG